MEVLTEVTPIQGRARAQILRLARHAQAQGLVGVPPQQRDQGLALVLWCGLALVLVQGLALVLLCDLALVLVQGLTLVLLCGLALALPRDGVCHL